MKKPKFKKEIYLITAIAMVITVAMVGWLLDEELGDALSEFPEGDSVYWVAGLALLIVIILIFGTLFLLSWKRQKVQSDYKKRKICASCCLLLFLPLALGLPVYNSLSLIPSNRGPYLSWTQDPKTSMTITWESKRSDLVGLIYGNENDAINIEANVQVNGPRETDGYYHYTTTLTGLEAGNEYFYKVKGMMEKPVSFKTAPSNENSPFKFILYGDSREPEKLFGNQHIDLVEQMIKQTDSGKANEYAFAINSGDTTREHDFETGWNLHFFAIKDLANQIPYFVAAGNHEWDTDNNWGPNQPANFIQEFPKEDKPTEEIGGWDEISYSFGYGPCYFINLGYPHAGANKTEHPEVNQWLNEQLAIGNSSYMFTFVSFHRPPFDDRVGTSGDDNADIIRNQCPLFHLGDADVIVNGHNHVLARHNISYAHDDDGQEITYLTTGGGGASLREYEAGTWDNKYGLGFQGSTITTSDIAQTYHFYVCEVDPTNASLTFTAYDINGNIVDEFVQFAN